MFSENLTVDTNIQARAALAPSVARGCCPTTNDTMMPTRPGAARAQAQGRAFGKMVRARSSALACTAVVASERPWRRRGPMCLQRTAARL